MTPDDLRSTRRLKPITRARWALAHVLIDRVGWSTPRVGDLINKHHTTILHGWRESRSLRCRDEAFFDAIEYLEQQL